MRPQHFYRLTIIIIAGTLTTTVAVTSIHYDYADQCMHTCPSPRFLVDMRWMKQWKRYVGYDQWDQSSAGLDSAHPGPVDNSGLFKSEYTHCEYIRVVSTCLYK